MKKFKIIALFFILLLAIYASNAQSNDAADYLSAPASYKRYDEVEINRLNNEIEEKNIELSRIKGKNTSLNQELAQLRQNNADLQAQLNNAQNNSNANTTVRNERDAALNERNQWVQNYNALAVEYKELDYNYRILLNQNQNSNETGIPEQKGDKLSKESYNYKKTKAAPKQVDKGKVKPSKGGI
jgi:septal ring factor EnvC (AmiA/AmiB activator)